MFQTHQDLVVKLIDEKLTEMRNEWMESLPPGAPVEEEDDSGMAFADGEEDKVVVPDPTTQGTIRVTYRHYSYDGRYWDVPKDFQFPTGAKLNTGWKMWLCGLPGNQTLDPSGNRQQAPIRPFRKLKLEMMPKHIKQKFQLQWRPIFSLMEQAPEIEIRETGIDAEYIDSTFNAGVDFLKTRVGYVFENEALKPMAWGVSTWSKKVSRSEIVKHGTEQDKANLPPETYRNKSREQHTRNRPEAQMRRVRQRLNHAGVSRASRRRADEVEGELPDLRGSLPPVALARDAQRQQQARADMAQALQEEDLNARRANACIGIARGDGTTVHIGPRFSQQDPLRDLRD